MSKDARLWAYLLFLTACWGSAFPLVRFVVASMPPFALSAARAAVGAATLAAFLWWRGELMRPDRAALRHMVVLGTINGWVPNVLTALSLGQIESATAALIQAAGPLIVAALSMVWLREERLSGLGAAALATGFAGVALVIGPLAVRGGATLLGGLCMLGTAASYACATIYARRARLPASAPIVLGQQVFSLLPALALSLLIDLPGAWSQPPEVWAIVATLGVLGSAVPLTLYLRLLTFARATDAALIGYLQPIWAALLGAALLAEWPDARVLLGGAVVLTGVYLAGRARQSGAADRA